MCDREEMVVSLLIGCGSAACILFPRIEHSERVMNPYAETDDQNDAV